MRAAVTTSRMSLVQMRPRAWSVAPFLRLIVAHFEWPLMMGALCLPPTEPNGKVDEALLAHLLGQIALAPELLDEPEVRLEPIDRLLLRLQNRLEQRARAVVALGDRERDAAVQARMRLFFDGEIDAMH